CPRDLQGTGVDQWHVSYQKQLSTDWMVSANYIGSITNHIWGTDQINPAVYIPGASTVNTTQSRRVFNMQNPAEGQYFASIQELDDDASSNYNGVLLSVQKRQRNGFSLQGNYALSLCLPHRCTRDPVAA